MLSACVTYKNKQSPFSTSLKKSSPQKTFFPDPADQNIESKSLSKSPISLQQIKQIEAKHTDLPIPLNAVPVPSLCEYDNQSSEQFKLAYNCSRPFESIKSFYDQSMEQWQEVGRFEGEELLISYQRPDSWCSISIKPNKSKTEPNLIVYMAQARHVVS